jgi:hypothetical protein
MIATEQENEQAVLETADRPIGGPHFSLIAGPCTVVMRAAHKLPMAEFADYLKRVRVAAAVARTVLVS